MAGPEALTDGWGTGVKWRCLPDSKWGGQRFPAAVGGRQEGRDVHGLATAPSAPSAGPAASQGPLRVPRHGTEAASSTARHRRDPAWPLQMFSEWLTNRIGPGECAWLLGSDISLEIEAIWVCSQARAGLAGIGCDYKKQVRRECYCKENWIHVSFK